MKNKSIRQVDELGRIVLPEGIRMVLNLKAGDAMEISVEHEVVALRKVIEHEPVREDACELSKQGRAFLNDPVLYELLLAEAETVGVTPREYLLRFEEALAHNAEAIFGIFEK